ncbi:hypothetical protein BKA80DRAFT_269392 [Phyllosticta citrichinensis]
MDAPPMSSPPMIAVLHHICRQTRHLGRQAGKQDALAHTQTDHHGHYQHKTLSYTLLIPYVIAVCMI